MRSAGPQTARVEEVLRIVESESVRQEMLKEC